MPNNMTSNFDAERGGDGVTSLPASQRQIRAGEFNPAMLTTAREAKKLSQAELASAMNVTQPLINQWEAIGVPGAPVKRPGPDQVNQLAGLLQVHPSLFYVTRPTRLANLSEFYHRALAKAKRLDVKAAHARCSLIDLQVDRLLELCPPAEDRIPDIDPDNHAGDIEKVAVWTRARMGIPPGPIDNLVDRIEACGGIVIDHDLDIDNVDALCRWVPGLPKLFFLNGARPGDRTRLTLAHELGHTVMHFNRDVDPDLAEEQAKRFSAAFMLPETEVRRDFGVKLDIPRLVALKRKWRVSMQALAYRAHQIGCIDKTRYTSIFQQLSRQGWRKTEPEGFASESPRAFKRFLRAHLDVGYSKEQLAEMLFVSRERLDDLLIDSMSPDWQDSGVRMRIAR
jgi:Zn-dependent peptidase ImmA (M78 family)/transcriptional regulator with XRE-family HTH domain